MKSQLMNAKDHFDQSPSVYLVGLRFTEDENTNEWEKRKMDYVPVSSLPTNFQDLLSNTYGNQCSFLLALHPQNINKETLSVIGSAHIFVDRKVLKQKLFQSLHKRFSNPEAFSKSKLSRIRPTDIEPGFIDKLIEMFRDIQRFVNKTRFDNYLAAYTALKCKCEAEYDFFMNVHLWKDILENFCDRTHSQYGIVAIVRADMIIVNKEIWKAYLEQRKEIFRREDNKRKQQEMNAENVLKKKQLSAREQCVELIGEEFSKKWETLPTDMKMFLAGI